MASGRALATRASWNLIDQALYALANMLLVMVVAREMSPDDFGSFSIGFLIYSIGVAVAKAASGQPLQISHSAETPERFRVEVSRSNGATLALALAGSAGLVLAGLILGDATGRVLLAMAICLPGLMIQDNYRMAFFANGQAHFAALIDFVKAVLQFGLLWALIVMDVSEVGILTLSWGVAGTLSAVVAAVLLSSWPDPRACVSWFREKGSLVKYLMGMYVLGLGAAQLGQMLIPVFGTARDAGSIRAADTLRGPLNVLGQAALAFAVPEISRRSELGARARLKGMYLLSAAIGVIATVYITVLLLIPDWMGQFFFGESWAGAQSVLLPMGLLSIVAGFCSGPGALLLGMGLAKKTFRINVLKAPVLLGMLVPGTLLWGAPGAAWAMLAAEIVVAPAWYITAIRAGKGRYSGEADRVGATAEA